MWVETLDSPRNVKYRDTMRLIWESRIPENMLFFKSLHRRQQLLFCSEICVYLDSERNHLLPGVRCWPHCQCSGDIDLLATLCAAWSYGPMLQFPAPPLRCHSNGCLCAEMSRNGTKPDNFQCHHPDHLCNRGSFTDSFLFDETFEMCNANNSRRDHWTRMKGLLYMSLKEAFPIKNV